MFFEICRGVMRPVLKRSEQINRKNAICNLLPAFGMGGGERGGERIAREYCILLSRHYCISSTIVNLLFVDTFLNLNVFSNSFLDSFS